MNDKNGQVNLTIVGKGMKLTGELFSYDDIRIDGMFNGEMRIRGRIVVSENGYLKGDVEARDITIQGKAEGEFEAKNNFYITPGGSFEGSVRTRFINITESAFFNGTCNIFPGKESSVHNKERKRSLLGADNLIKPQGDNKEDIDKSQIENEKTLSEERKSENTSSKDTFSPGSPEISLLKSKISQIQSL